MEVEQSPGVQCFNGSGAVTHYLLQYHSVSVQNVTTDGITQTISDLTLVAKLQNFMALLSHHVLQTEDQEEKASLVGQPYFSGRLASRQRDIKF